MSSEEDPNESDMAPEPFKMTFEIPCGDAAVDLEVMSTEVWTHFLEDMCRTMGCRVSSLRVGYIFSFIPKNPKPLPKLLNDEKTWAMLIRNAYSWVEGECKKKNGKGVAKPWTIGIIDLTAKTKDGAQVSAYLYYNSVLHIPNRLWSLLNLRRKSMEVRHCRGVLRMMMKRTRLNRIHSSD
jgi:hypothetical protein